VKLDSVKVKRFGMLQKVKFRVGRCLTAMQLMQFADFSFNVRRLIGQKLQARQIVVFMLFARKIAQFS
jgi:hypothetical protein